MNIIYRIVKNIIRLISLFIPRNEDLWVFCAGQGDKFTGNSKYAFLYVDNKEDVSNVWIATEKSVKDALEKEGYSAHIVHNLAGKYTLLRAGVVLYTHSIPKDEYVVGAEKVYLSHGNYLKYMGDDVNPRSDQSRLDCIEQKIGNILGKPETYYTVTAGGKPQEIFQSAYDPGESNFLITGFPRNDVLFENIDGEEIRVNSSYLNHLKRISKDTTVIFYTPTHRQAFGNLSGRPLSEIIFDFDRVDEFLESIDAILYISLHPYTDLEWNNEYDNIIQLNSGDDVYPFLRYADVLITDYSSIFYDFLLLNRPVLFYSPDLEEYESSRNFYVGYRSHVPGPLIFTTSELISSLNKEINNHLNYSEKRNSIVLEYYTYRDGSSSARLYNTVKSKVL